MDSHIPQWCFILSLLCAMNSLPIVIQNIFPVFRFIEISSSSPPLTWVPVSVGSTFPSLSAEDSPSSSKNHPGKTHQNSGVAQDVIYLWDVFLDLSFIIFSKYSGVIIPKLPFKPHCFLSGVGEEALSFPGKREKNSSCFSVCVTD